MQINNFRTFAAPNHFISFFVVIPIRFIFTKLTFYIGGTSIYRDITINRTTQ